MKLIVIYDDTGRKSEVITDIIGRKGFADVVVKKRHLEDYYREALEARYPDLVWRKVHVPFEYEDLVKELQNLSASEVKVFHCFANYFITDRKLADLSFRKVEYVDDPYAIYDDAGRTIGAMFPDLETYIAFVEAILGGTKAWDQVRTLPESFEMEGLVDIGVIGNFIQVITGNFDSRYFNSLEGNDFTLVKRSPNKEKIRAEYNFYHLLPEDMKYWFVMPFNYAEDESEASYTMERLHMTDLAIKWVHGSMDETEFSELMDKYFYFFSCRHAKDCSAEEYAAVANDLYVDKVNKRVADLKSLPQYADIERLLSVSGEDDLDTLVAKYLDLKERVEKKAKYENKLCIGHGDPCFANALYNKSTRTLKFVDPKGALTEEDLWTNPYYDVAKLSHSVCGRYDFFNNAMFDIKLGEDLTYQLEIPFDNARYKEIFREKCEANGFDWWSVRVYEASLFLSMLPLHIDNPQKVFGLLLNAKNILKEIEENV